MLASAGRESPAYCSALTARGKRCRNLVLDCSDRCAFHTGVAAEARRRRREWWKVAGVVALVAGTIIGGIVTSGVLQDVFVVGFFALLGISLLLETNWGRGHGDTRDPWLDGYDDDA